MPTDLDHRLRAYADRWRDDQPPPADLSPSTAVRPHARRPWFVVAVAAAVVVGAALTATGVTAFRRSTSRPTALSAVVAWNPSGQVVNTTPISRAPQAVAPVGLRTCSGRDFVVLSAHTQAASAVEPEPGWLLTSYVLRSTATSDCAVAQVGLGATLVDASGQPLPNDAAGGSGEDLSVLSVRPGQFVSSGVVWFWNGRGVPRPERILVEPVLGGTITGAGELAISVGGVRIPAGPSSPFDSPGTTPRPWRTGSTSLDVTVSAPDPLALVTMTVQAPTSVRLGVTLHYTVALANPSDQPISLKDCPQVSQILSRVSAGPSVQAGTRGRLNCSGVSPIPPHDRVVFAFELSTDGLSVGDYSLRWGLMRGASIRLVSYSVPTVEITR